MDQSRFVQLVLVSGFLLSACATVGMHSDWDKTADFSHLRTYQWTSESQKKTGNPRLDDPALDMRIRKIVEEVLAVKGYQKQESGLPDFWVSYYAAIEGKLDIRVVGDPLYRTPNVRRDGSVDFNNEGLLGAPNIFKTPYEEGALILDIADSKTQKLLWRGTMSGVVERYRSPEERERRVKSSIGKLLKKFPPP